ncbi:hypothetical protein BV25DRAFT_1920544 [Artomyces pyxidatus]|uniref:Uncharacterized protein n=1 Tax=Artomyces pyxidatus TaxID=48021 RepID=A0ACB8SM96_9AGAM|nr:hypothetical protein BV25DRAFT_1920544 [Artomyces pyxidatus]
MSSSPSLQRQSHVSRTGVKTPLSILNPPPVSHGKRISTNHGEIFPHSSGHRITKPAERAMAVDLHGKMVGPMAVKTFLETFLPPLPDKSTPILSTVRSLDIVENANAPKVLRRRSPTSRTPESPLAARTSLRSPAARTPLVLPLSRTRLKGRRQFGFSDVSAAPTESLMYEPFIEACKRIAPDLDFVNSSGNGDPECQLSGDALKPDVAVYARDSGCTRDSDFSRMEMHIEFKYNTFGDPFQDPVFVDAVGFANRRSQSFEKVDCEMAADTCGQIVAYASAQMYLQFRTHCFSILVVGDRARLIRWDHAGVVATVAFNYVLEPQLLVDFFQRYVQASDAVRGKDRTVRDATPEERCAAEAHLGPSDRYLTLEVAISFMDPGTEETVPIRTLIVAAPRYSTHTLLGRSTRGMVAFDMTSQRKVFLKDTWRIDLPELSKEGDTYEVLQAANVKNIAKFIGACDVSDTMGGEHATLTQVYARMAWACGTDNVIGYRHYRLLLDTIGEPIWMFKSSRQLISTVWDALEGHRDAYEAGILHRDVSVGNILIGPDGQGLLIDWDLATSVTELNRPGRGRDMTGTWQFSSAAMLMHPETHRHVLADDLESFMHVSTWLALRYCPHNLDAHQLGRLLRQNFDCADRIGEEDVGGYGKEVTIVRGEFMPDPHFTESPVLNELFPALFSTFAVRYRTPPTVWTHVQLDLPDMETPEMYKRWQEALLPRLQSHAWMLATGKKMLAYPDAWPLDDRAEEQPFVFSEPKAYKRPSERESAHYPAKRLRQETKLNRDELVSDEGTSNSSHAYRVDPSSIE